MADTRPAFTRADLVKVDPWDVRTGDLMAHRTNTPGEWVGWLVTASSTLPNGDQLIVYDTGTWDGQNFQPPSIPVWIVDRDKH